MAAISATSVACGWRSQAQPQYRASAERPPVSDSAYSTRAKEVAGRRVRPLASNEPMPIAKTITDSTTEVWVTESPSR